MSRRGIGMEPPWSQEKVRPATTEEAASINFLPRLSKKRTREELIESDPTLRKIAAILEEDRNATALVINTSYDRVAVLRVNLAKVGIDVETREAVGEYGDSTDPLTFAIRRKREVEKPVEPEKPPKTRKVIHYE